ncbi:MAG: riboflavin synthase [Elusimicrobia bacterium]|nr:riboflavin synthase [Elusimicrobiota bacterium]
MFQGIVSQKARVIRQQNSVLLLRPQKNWKTKKGESVAVNGVCLTLKNSAKNQYSFDLGEETKKATTLGSLRPGSWVNIEKPIRFTEPVSGHILLGHVDKVGRIISREQKNNSLIIEIEIPAPLGEFVAAHKGSIGIDGVSLTVNQIYATRDNVRLAVCIIPETMKKTTLSDKTTEDRVNVEIDYLAKVVLTQHNNFEKERTDIMDIPKWQQIRN